MPQFRFYITSVDVDGNRVETQVSEEMYNATQEAAGFRIELVNEERESEFEPRHPLTTRDEVVMPKVLTEAEQKLSAIYDIVTNTDDRRTRARKEAWEAVKRVLADLEPAKAEEPEPAPEVEDTTPDVAPAVDEPVPATPTSSATK